MPRTPTCGVLHMKQGPALSEIVRAISVGILDRPFLLQLLSVFSAYLAAVLSSEWAPFSVDGTTKVGESTFLMATLSALLCGRLSDR
jgi:hypothetical protein